MGGASLRDLMPFTMVKIREIPLLVLIGGIVLLKILERPRSEFNFY